VTKILQEAERIDREEDERYGDARGDELPESLRTREGRRAALMAAREKLCVSVPRRSRWGEEVIANVEVDLEPDRYEVRPEGRRAWLREARRDVEAQRVENPWPVPRSRHERLVEAKRRMDEELAVEHAQGRVVPPRAGRGSRAIRGRASRRLRVRGRRTGRR